MKIRKGLLSALLLFLSGATQAQTKQQLDSLHDYCYVCTDNKHLIIRPPYTKKFVKELPFVATSAAVLAAGLAAGALNKTEPYTDEELLTNPPDLDDLNWLDRGSALNWSPTISRTSDGVLWTITILPALFLSENHTGRDIRTLLIMYAEVFTLNYGLTELAKNTVNRSRPYVYNAEVPLGIRGGSVSRKSFYSGHTSQTAAASFFFAKVITDYHPTLKRGIKWGLWVFAAAVPAVNGYFRVWAGRHFPTDVITGYVAGAATGWLIPQLHRTPRSKAATEKLQVGFIPVRGTALMTVNYRF